jgi:hypothetical protein
MKNLLLSAFLGLAALMVTPAVSNAGTFGLFTGCGCCGCCNKCTFCVRPYNAFTPVCCGNITCMGCSPLMAPYGNYGGYGFGGDGACASAGCAPGETITNVQIQPSTPAAPSAPTKLTPQYAQPTPLIPVPQPTAAPTGNGTSMAPNPYGTIQAGYYYPTVAPAYNPYVFYGAYGAAPYYWNAK